jgi:hypothetical protein
MSRVCKSYFLDPVLSWLIPVHTPTPYFPNISHVILGITGSPLPFDFQTKILYGSVTSGMRAVCPTDYSLIDFNHYGNIW